MSFGAVIGGLLGKAGSAFASGVGSAAGTAIGTKIGGGSTDNIYNIYQGGGGPGSGGVTLLDELALKEIKTIEGAKQRTEQMILQQEQAKLDKATIDSTLELGRLQLEAEKLGVKYQQDLTRQEMLKRNQALQVMQYQQMQADKETGILGSLVTTLAVNRAQQPVEVPKASPVQEASNMPLIVAAAAVAALSLILVIKKR